MLASRVRSVPTTARTWVAFACAIVSAVACVSTPEEEMAGWRERAVSLERWETVRPYLEDLKPGDDLALFVGAREVHLRDGRRSLPVVVIPSWISSLSGGAAGGLSMFGQLVGRAGERVRGSHLFGTAVGDRIVPRFQVFTEATIIDREEYARLATLATPRIGAIPRPGGPLFFRGLYVAGGRALPVAEASAPTAEEAAEETARVAPSAESFLTRDAAREAAATLETLPEGTDLLSLLRALDAEYLTSDFGETHSLRAKGFLHAGAVRTQTLESADGIYKLRAFGWQEGEEEVVEHIAVFENDRLVGVVAHRDVDDWTIYLREVLAARPSGDRADLP